MRREYPGRRVRALAPVLMRRARSDIAPLTPPSCAGRRCGFKFGVVARWIRWGGACGHIQRRNGKCPPGKLCLCFAPRNCRWLVTDALFPAGEAFCAAEASRTKAGTRDVGR